MPRSVTYSMRMSSHACARGISRGHNHRSRLPLGCAGAQAEIELAGLLPRKTSSARLARLSTPSQPVRIIGSFDAQRQLRQVTFWMTTARASDADEPRRGRDGRRGRQADALYDVRRGHEYKHARVPRPAPQDRAAALFGRRRAAPRKSCTSSPVPSELQELGRGVQAPATQSWKELRT